MEVIKNSWTKVSTSLVETLFDLIVIVLIFVIAKYAINIFSKFTGKGLMNADKLEDKEKSQQLKTSMTVAHSANRYIIYAFAFILCLGVLGIGDISKAEILAGVGGLVLSLGAQSIVKDIIAGVFLLFERQFYVGDYVKIGNYEGTVTSIALRVVYLDCGGKKVIIPNGEIKDVINYSRINSLAIITIPTPYEEDTRKIMFIIQSVIDKYYKTHSNLLTENKALVPGISSFEASSVNITIRIETKPLKHWEVQRDLMLLIKEEFKKKGIEMPYQKIQVVNK